MPSHETHAAAAPTPPAAPRRPVEEVLHGQRIVDPYRWLEDGADPEVRAWTAAQNAHTDRVLANLPQRAYFEQQLRELAAEDELVTMPVLRGDRMFFLRRRAGDNQPALWVRSLDGGDEALLVDPNAQRADGTVALDWWYPSPDGRLLAYGLSEDGTEESVLHVMGVDTGRLEPDRIPRTRHCSLAWLPDGSGFYYTRHPEPGSVAPGEEFYHRRVYFHRLGDDPTLDPMVFGAERPVHELPHVVVSDDGRYVMVLAHQGWRSTEVFLFDRHDPERGWLPLLTGYDARFDGCLLDGRVYLLTNWQAPYGRIVAVDPADPRPEAWQEIVPASDALVLREFVPAGGHLLVMGLSDAVSRLFLVPRKGGAMREVALPGSGTATHLSGSSRAGVAVACFESFALAPRILRIDPTTGTASTWLTSRSAVKDDDVLVERTYATSRDGTRVPLFVLRARDAKGSGARPTVLTGYGGFNVARTPQYDPFILPWLKAGGVWALAVLRGGGEYGETWHRAGMLGNKQNVFDDFIAAAEHLIAEGVTEPQRLGILGRSNGGLLVGAAMTQRPDLFRAVVCGVPLLDMLRYHRFLIGAQWVGEYGSPENPVHFAWLRAYSPYHNVREGERYPAVYLFAAAADIRVDALHARKMAALLQTASGSGLPVLLRVEDRVGHGAGKPLARVIEERVELWTFLAWQLGLPVATGRMESTRKAPGEEPLGDRGGAELS